ncbi:alpha/beta fold hydrolase [Erwiniaceae bacterium BAC15a-03b]|uniref:Alpha/beta fold hydrolase n=1 Tax=Winslowiella arboricola TaxID=2978220 RepID=A0A9J6PVD2_9GAMM|nr:alpha/beta fold hydrolase [Winslowiella arboricola]MCU5775505.1 alpha/beta fold hydrolase [Winslowiella arboricola]MCU5779645.1 alpha/beta fold hydrolase [Winslowiella arboricola]
MSNHDDAYRQLGELLDAAGLAEHALFLNWGFQPADGPALPPGDAQRQLVLQLIGDHPVDGRHILDVGCGRGGTAALLVEKWRPLSVTGVDLSSSNIHFCRQRHRQPRLRFQLADACQLPQADNSVDMVLNIESSGAYPDLTAFFRQVWRVLKPGGDFFYSDIFARQTRDDVQTAISQLGFQAVNSYSIRQAVLAARRSAGEKVIERLLAARQPQHAQLDIAELRNYFALPGTPIYQALENGQADYYCFHWRKPASAQQSQPLPEALLSALNQRSQRLDQAVNGSDSAVFPLGKPHPQAALNLFALPYAGGGASVYRDWGQTDGWPDDWRFCAMQLAGRENRIDDAPQRRMENLVAELAQQIEPYSHRPWALLGCSLGCKVAFELARYFSQRHRAPRLLFLMACPAPDIALGQRISECSDAEFCAEVRRLGGTPDSVLLDQEMMQTVGKALRADCALAENYQAATQSKLAVPALLVLAEDDALVPVASMLRWQQHLTASTSIKRVRGGHFFLRQQRATLQQWLVQALRQSLPAASESAARWLPFGLPQTGAGLPLFCFHHAGGNAASWRDWITAASALGMQLCPIELPGRASRFAETPRSDLNALLAELCAALTPLCQQPFALLGHSLGALMAFELAQQLPATQLQGVFVSGRRPPHHPTPQPLRHLMNDNELTQQLKGLEGTPADVLQHQELLALFLPALRADFTLTERYNWQQTTRRLSLPLQAFCGDSDAEVSLTAMQEWLEYGDRHSQLHRFAGGHFYLHHHRDALLQAIAARLNLR